MGATAPAASRAMRRTREAASAVGGSRPARLFARLGYVARGVFYGLLVFITARIAAEQGAGPHQANAHGALSIVAESTAGKVAIAATAAGFLMLGVVRLAGAVRDRSAPRWRRVLTMLYGLFYVALTYVPLSFLLGHRQTGSEQQEHSETARLLSWPGGREILVALGLVVIGVCAWQVWTGLDDDFMDSMDVTPAWMEPVTRTVGTVGIVARAAVFVPVGVFLVVASVQADPRHADGLDRELSSLATRSWWGPAILGLVAFGLLTFAAYSLLEARYRRIGSGR